MPMDSYDPRNLIQAVQAAEQAGIAVLIVDSWSHFWNGRGGLLEIVENAGSGTMGTFGGWKKGNPIEQDMLDALLNFSGHLIVTMRTKTDYLVDGKTITKVGTKVVQRESSDYELGLIIDMVEGTGTVTKTRYEVLEGLSIHHPGEDLGQQVLEQLGQGVDPVEVILNELTADGLTYAGALELHARAKSRGLLTRGTLHPTSGEPTTIGALIAEYGKALKPGPAPAPAPPAPVQEQQQAARESSEPSPAPAPPAAAPQPARDAEGMATPAQMRKIFATLKDLQFAEDRDTRLHAVSLLLGRQVPTMNDLNWGEASALIETLADFAQHADDGPQKFRDYLNELHAKAQPADAAA
jgi:hypothetical protein